MGESAQDNHSTLANQLALLTCTVNRMRTDQRRWIECIRVVDAVFTKVVQVQKTHMDLIWSCCSIADIGASRRNVIEERRKECERLAEDIRLLKTNILERISVCEADTNVSTFPGQSGECIESPASKCAASVVKEELPEDSDLELVRESGNNTGFVSVTDESANTDFQADYQRLIVIASENEDAQASCVAEKTAGSKDQADSRGSRNSNYTVCFVDANALVTSEVPVIGSEGLPEVSTVSSIEYNPARTVKAEQTNDEEDWNEWSPTGLDHFTETDNHSLGTHVTENQSPLFDSTVINNIKKEEPDILEVKNDARTRGPLESRNTRHTGAKRFACKICDKKFGQSQHLAKHTRTHNGEKPFKCDICEKPFSQRWSLTTHLRTHTGETPFSCKVCHKKFSQSGNLFKHMRIHNDERPYTCERCKKTFRENGDLTTHMRTHNGDRPFKCEMCEKTFYKGGDLTRHVRIHNGEKYECKICGKKLSRHEVLLRHMRLHERENQYECGVCDERFLLKKDLVAHVGLHED